MVQDSGIQVSDHGNLGEISILELIPLLILTLTLTLTLALALTLILTLTLTINLSKFQQHKGKVNTAFHPHYPVRHIPVFYQQIP